ncbi:MAG: butyrate kinase [Tissierellia bacterium]|nr:butyrate kinase [Tissierellia bacterium]
MLMKILVINPGSTSTKIAVYDDENIMFKVSLDHSVEELKKYETIGDQYPMRMKLVTEALESNNLKLEDLDCIVGRGGPVAPLQSGAYEVNKALCDKLLNNPMAQHASNLAGVIAYHIGQDLGIPAYIYDSVATDELREIARITGLKEVRRSAMAHALNMRANALKYAKSQGVSLIDVKYVIVHLGGGITLSVFDGGKMVDMVSDDEGAFSPERSGGLPLRKFLRLSTEMDEETMLKKLRSQGGLNSHLGTTDVREVEARISEGDEYAKLVLDAMIYNVAKAVGALSTVVEGKVDAIILTGGIAFSEKVTKALTKRIEFIAPVVVVPGENELEALAFGGLRVMRGQEQAHVFED